MTDELQKVAGETMRFMRGKYKLDELPGQSFGVDCLKFRQGKKTILIIQIHEDHYVFQIIHGKAEREKFEARRGEFPQAIQDIYDAAPIFDGGKWLFIPVFDLETLEAVKKLILMKKNPNRKPFPVTHIHRGSCGHRCDLCVHYTGETSFSTEELDYARECCTEVYGVGDFGNKFCDGCHFPDCDVGSAICRKAKGTEKCWDCENYTTCLNTAGYPPEIHTRTITADQVTYAILPYVKGQYGN
ncbi:MAG: DUF3788 domain-containing protein [Oscillospiraceae bacterium]|jgi:hypothetical protein|nr:DUF3788 domain-containing protein [Oscillospiraceae bacterium]